MSPATLYGDNSAIYPSASFSRDPFFPFMPHIALEEQEMGVVGHQQPGYILDHDWGKGTAACLEMGTELPRAHQGMNTKAITQSSQ